MIRKKVFFPILALAIIGAGLIKTDLASAQDITGPNSLISAIAQKFNLNETDVKAVFEEERNKREETIKNNFEAKLNKAVADGKITDSQKQAILTKFSEMKNNKPNPEDFKNLTPEQKKAKIDQKKTEMESWAKENGINLDTLRQILGGFPGRRFGHHMGMMQMF